MNMCLQILSLLAEEAANGQQRGIFDFVLMMLPFIVIILLFNWLFVPNPQKRELKHIEALKSSLKKNDPVVTAGGIIGTVANVSPERNEVTIKVDDNTKIRVQMRSVLAIPKPDGKSPKDAKPEPPAAEAK